MKDIRNFNIFITGNNRVSSLELPFSEFCKKVDFLVQRKGRNNRIVIYSHSKTDIEFLAEKYSEVNNLILFRLQTIDSVIENIHAAAVFTPANKDKSQEVINVLNEFVKSNVKFKIIQY